MLLSIFCYIFAFLHFYIIKVFEVLEVATGKPLHAGGGGADVGIIGLSWNYWTKAEGGSWNY